VIVLNIVIIILLLGALWLIVALSDWLHEWLKHLNAKLDRLSGDKSNNSPNGKEGS
jgi:hypothetical protein